MYLTHASYRQFYPTFLNYHFKSIVKVSDSYFQTSLFSLCNVVLFAFLADFWQIFAYQNKAPSLNMILFQTSATHCSYLLDQLNLAFKCFFVNASFSCHAPLQFLFSRDALSSIYWHQIGQVALLHNLFFFFLFFFYFLIFLVEFILSWSVSRTIQCCRFRGLPRLNRSETLPVHWNFRKISEMPLLEIFSSLSIVL